MIMALADGNGLPVAIGIESGSRGDVTLVDQTLDEAVVVELSPRLIADKAFDSAKLEKSLRGERNIELIAPVDAPFLRCALGWEGHDAGAHVSVPSEHEPGMAQLVFLRRSPSKSRRLVDASSWYALVAWVLIRFVVSPSLPP